MVDAMADRRATGTPPALLVAIELSKASWLLAVHDPTTDKISRHRIEGGHAAGLIALIGAARRGAPSRWSDRGRVRVRGGLRWLLAPPPPLGRGNRLPGDGSREPEGRPARPPRED